MNTAHNSHVVFDDHPTYLRRVSTWPTKLEASLARLAALGSARRQHAREMRDLFAFSDTELRDIGLTRADTYAIRNGTYRRD